MHEEKDTFLATATSIPFSHAFKVGKEGIGVAIQTKKHFKINVLTFKSKI